MARAGVSERFLVTGALGCIGAWTVSLLARDGAGVVHVNQQTAGADVHVPFGGLKGSGYGPHEQGRAAMEFYTEVITVYEDV